MSLEDDYRAEERAIRAAHPPGPERRRLKRDLVDRFDGRRFEIRGNLDLIYRHQQRFAGRYIRIIKAFYDGATDDATYRGERRSALRAYARALFKAGILTAVFDNTWPFFDGFVRSSLRAERQLVPVKTTGLSQAELESLCGPLRDRSKAFFENLHRDFGIGRLRRHPRIIGGVDLAFRDQERRDVPDA